MSDSEDAGPPHRQAPVTGHHDIDRALAALDLSGDVAEQPQRIAAALDAVARALTGPAIPQALRPGP
nr:hypothetical protein [Propionibacterium sp.]